uniref:Uncharacterized protein n=1 Tax=Glossina austeni TaxID=7395 RepID=A0A1A9UZC6_GLOAU
MPSSVSSKDNSFSTFSKACCISHTGLHINFTDSACGAEEAVIIITDCEMTSASTAHSLSGKTIRPSPTAPEMSMSLVSVSLVFDESLSDFLLFFFKDCSVTSSLPDSIRALAKWRTTTDLSASSLIPLDYFTFTSVELRISTNSLVRVPTLTDKSTKRLKNMGGSSPVDLSSITSSTSLRMTSLPFVRAKSV